MNTAEKIAFGYKYRLTINNGKQIIGISKLCKSRFNETAALQEAINHAQVNKLNDSVQCKIDFFRLWTVPGSNKTDDEFIRSIEI